MRGYLLIDGNSVAYAATAVQKLHVGAMEVQGIYGMLRTIRQIMLTYPQLAPVVLWDGVSWRTEQFKEYKASRDQEGTDEKPLTKAQLEQRQIRESLKVQKKHIMTGLKLLGVTQMRAQNLEADDLAGMLIQRYQPLGKKIMMISGDADWIQLVGPGTGWRDHRNDKRVTLSTIKAVLGVDTPQQWLEVKALMGDKSDEVPGVGGIGEKGAVELINTYGSVISFFNQVMDGTVNPASLHKKFRDLAEDPEKQAIFTRNMRLMDLRSPLIPKPIDLRITSADLNILAFDQFCRILCFQSFLTDLPGWCEPFNYKSRSAA